MLGLRHSEGVFFRGVGLCSVIEAVGCHLRWIGYPCYAIRSEKFDDFRAKCQHLSRHSMRWRTTVAALLDF